MKTTYAWFRSHRTLSLMMTGTFVLLVTLASISSFGTPAGWQ